MAANDKFGRQTRLSRIHPYPAMIADELAINIVKRHVQPGSIVLDPFCGTARTLYAAAAQGAECWGIDVNPLAVLIAQAKSVTKFPAMPARQAIIAANDAASFDIAPKRKVKWFPKSAEREISALITWINSLKTSRATTLGLACILSATVREVCFCRKRQWKLHRMSSTTRRKFRPSALRVFQRRLNAVKEALQKQKVTGKVRISTGNAKTLGNLLGDSGFPPSFDVIFTSPPYGDSPSTVGYGGISSICLGVLQHLNQLKLPFCTGHQIDSECLGGKHEARQRPQLAGKYWKGSSKSVESARIIGFLQDVATACQQIARASHAGTKVILVVARRSVRHRRLYLDWFLRDQLGRYGFQLIENSRRRIAKKNTPHFVDRKARTNSTDRTKTMDYEFLLVFKKKCTNRKRRGRSS